MAKLQLENLPTASTLGDSAMMAAETDDPRLKQRFAETAAGQYVR